MRRNKTDERDDAERLRTVERLDDVRELLDEARRKCDARVREGEIVESAYFSKDGHGYCPHCGGVLL